MADLSDLQAAQTVKIAGSNSTTGAESAFVDSTANGGMHVNLRNDAGTEVGTAAAALRIDPTGTTAQPVTDAGGSLTVDGTVSAAQSGTWNITNISGTVSLPTGAATESTLSAQNTLIGAVTETAPGSDTASSGLNGRLQRIAQRLTSLIGLLPASLGVKTSALSLSVVQAENPTYSAAASAFASAATATDVFTITGSATKTIFIRKIRVSLSTTSGSAIKLTVQGIKRSAANTGGTSATLTNVPLDSSNAAATAVVRNYTANPSALGAAVGTMRSTHLGVTQSGLTGGAIEWSFETQPLTLRGVSELFAVNFNSTTVTGSIVSIYADWEEV